MRPQRPRLVQSPAVVAAQVCGEGALALVEGLVFESKCCSVVACGCSAPCSPTANPSHIMIR